MWFFFLPFYGFICRGAPYSSCERKGNQWIDFLMVLMASGIARGRVHTHDDDDDSGDGVAQHGGHTPKEVDRDIKPRFTV